MAEHPPRIETPRLVLRRPTPGDAPDVYEVHRHEAVADGVVSIPHPCPADHGQTWIAKILGNLENPNNLVWLIEERASGRVIGDCGLEYDTPRHRHAGIGYLMHPDFWGRGLVTEALAGMLRWAFAELDPPLHRVEADHHPENPASGRVCEKLGMRREGVLRGHILKNDEFRDAVRMGVLRDEFLALHGESS